MPAPNAYEPTHVFAKTSPPKYSFSGKSAQRPQTTESFMKSPGPGAYPHKNLVADRKKGGVIGQKFVLKRDVPGSNNVPGPGSYEIDCNPIKLSNPTWRIGTSRRDDQERIARRTQQFPPPNAYDPQFGKLHSSEPKWGFGSSKRGPLTDGKVVSPSPQTYNIPSKAIEGRSQGFGLKLENGSTISNKPTHVPGPGAYNPNFHSQINSLPKYSLKGRHQDRKPE